eukprot:15038495-Alexandrium_andersonii.AAC.1
MASGEQVHYEAAGIFRTLKAELQEKLNMALTLDMRILPWLVRRAAWCRARYAAGPDGLAPYQRLNGAAYAGTVATPGEIVM